MRTRDSGPYPFSWRPSSWPLSKKLRLKLPQKAVRSSEALKACFFCGSFFWSNKTTPFSFGCPLEDLLPQCFWGIWSYLPQNYGRRWTSCLSRPTSQKTWKFFAFKDHQKAPVGGCWFFFYSDSRQEIPFAVSQASLTCVAAIVPFLSQGSCWSKTKKKWLATLQLGYRRLSKKLCFQPAVSVDNTYTSNSSFRRVKLLVRQDFSWMGGSRIHTNRTPRLISSPTRRFSFSPKDQL